MSGTVGIWSGELVIAFAFYFFLLAEIQKKPTLPWSTPTLLPGSLSINMSSKKGTK